MGTNNSGIFYRFKPIQTLRVGEAGPRQPVKARNRFRHGDQICHWTLVAYDDCAMMWQARCQCQHLQLLNLRDDNYVPRCRKCGARSSDATGLGLKLREVLINRVA